MTYAEAIKKALAGDESGFQFIYESTKTQKYYLALKYVKDKEAAEDVLQEAYLKAWQNLDKVEPKKFEAWFAQIVANTAKTALEKRKHTPLDLREIGEADEEEKINEAFDRSVSTWENQPELAYTQQETAELVHELLDTLPDEQRFAILMNKIEGLTTREIAEALDCSEATVKSQINYAKKKIKAKAEELQKKGYKLYAIPPMVLLMLLLQKEEQVFAAETSTQAALNRCGQKLLEKSGSTKETVKQAAKSAASAKSESVKTAFLATKAGKTVAGIVLVTVAASAAVAGYINHDRSADTDTAGIPEEPMTEIQSSNENIEGAENIEVVEDAEPEETITLHDEVGWSDAYSEILQHIPDNTLYELGEISKFGFESEIYENLDEQGEAFEYALVDLDGNDIPELLIRANTSQTTYNGMSYWIMITYQKWIVDDTYTYMPVLLEQGRYPVTEGVASIGGSRVYVTMNEAMDEFLLESYSAGNGDTYIYRGYMEYDTGNYFWRQENVGYYTYDQTELIEEAKKGYPVEIQWNSITTPFSW